MRTKKHRRGRCFLLAMPYSVCYDGKNTKKGENIMRKRCIALVLCLLTLAALPMMLLHPLHNALTATMFPVKAIRASLEVMAVATITAPMKKEMSSTIAIEFTPNCSISLMYCRQ